MVVSWKTRARLAMIFSFLALLMLSGSESPSCAAQQEPYRILVTNEGSPSRHSDSIGPTTARWKR